MKRNTDQINQFKNNNAMMHILFEEAAKKNSRHTAIIFEDQSITYKELNKKANQLAHYLLTQIHPGTDTFIAVSMNRSIELIITILAILKSGCAYLPLDENQPTERQAFILEDAKPAILITQSLLKNKFSYYQGKKIFIDSISQEINCYPTHNPFVTLHSNNLAYVIYTSGSTGKSKGVLIEHKSLVNYIRWLEIYSGCRSQNKIDFSSNIIFDMAITTSIAALALNLKMVICSDKIKKNIRDYLNHIQKNKINIIKVTPSYFKLMMEEVRSDFIALPNLHSIILGGENLLANDCIDWLHLYPKHNLFNEYGPTETTVAVSQYKMTKKNIPQNGSVPIGQAGLNMEYLILDENKNPVQPNIKGELYIGGICLARAYLNQPELTANQFIQMHDKRWYKTGDICQYLQDGNIEFIGRIDDQIKIRGYKIEPREIELSLMTHPKIKDAVVISRKTRADDNRLIAYYILEDNSISLTQNELREYLRERLMDYMVPSNFVMLSLFPLTENGKLDKKALPDPLVVEEKSGSEPDSKLERRVNYIWRKAFQLENISMNADFFELGGNSLIAARIISDIEKYLNKKIDLEDIYTGTSIKKLSALIASADKIKKNNWKKIKSTKNIPLSDFQFVFWMSNLFAPQIKNLNIISRKRLSGKLNLETLKNAFETLFEKHEVLRYHASNLFPVQHLKENKHLQLTENDLRMLSSEEKELALSKSLDELINLYPWNNNQPLLAAKLFHLSDEITELQISASHMVFDDASEKILFSELSKVYGNNEMILQNDSREQVQYKDYIAYEHHHLNKRMKKDIRFWENYFNDTNLVALPSTDIIPNMENKPYSSYIELPDTVLANIQHYCKQSHVSITDVLCAAITLSLKKIAGHLNKEKIFINIVKSTRDNDVFDKVIGCFLRLDPIKVDINANLDLIELSKQIQKSRIETELHQECSGMMKVACLEKSSRKRFFKNALLYTAAALYSIIFKKFKINPRLLVMYRRLKLLISHQNFLINVNLLNNFISQSVEEEKLFGLAVIESQTHQYDISNVNNLLNICLFKNESLKKSYLVISGNLKESFRLDLGEKIQEYFMC